jgi:hypothetical protein
MAGSEHLIGRSLAGRVVGITRMEFRRVVGITRMEFIGYKQRWHGKKQHRRQVSRFHGFSPEFNHFY